MDQNIAYGVGQQKSTTQPINEENIYDDVLNSTEGNKSGEEKSKANLLLGRCLVGIVAIAAVLALTLAVVAIILIVTSNSNQEIQTLQLEIENLREMLNQTGDNSNQEIQSLQLEIEEVKEMLNQTDRSQNGNKGSFLATCMHMYYLIYKIFVLAILL